MRVPSTATTMDTANPPAPITSTRHKCPACFKQYKNKEHLVEHIRVSYHSVHQPKCCICKKHCKSLESVREHLTGPLSKGDCAKVFTNLGCELCLTIFDSSISLASHKELCCLSPTSHLDLMEFLLLEKPKTGIENFEPTLAGSSDHCREVVAMDCEMVGGGSDGSLDLCARVCIIDADENVIFHSFVKPQIPITDYRSEITGLKEDHLAEATPLALVKQAVEEILYNGESISKTRLSGGRARILIGHGLDHDLDCLKMNYPDHLLRDTAKFPPLMKTNLVSHQLKYLARTYLGYEIQSGIHDPYEDCVAAMRIYKRMRAQSHDIEPDYMSNSSINPDGCNGNNKCGISSPKKLEEKSPEELLLEMYCSKYKCWCLDAMAVIGS